MSSNELEQVHHSHGHGDGYGDGYGTGHAEEHHEAEGGHGEHLHMPSPSIWPIVNAFGITMLGFGFLAGIWYGFFGVIIIAYSVWKWAGEMRRDAR